MKTTIKKRSFLLPILALSLSMLAFTSRKGGEGFEIYLNNQLLLQQFGNQVGAVKNLSLDQSAAGGQLRVNYYHCGQAGKNRSITFKDVKNNVVKQWRFTDGTGTAANMVLNVKEILSLEKNKGDVLQLYYSSKEIPAGKLLTTLQLK